MNSIDSILPPDSHHLSAAQGWLELGCPAEAGAEIEKIDGRLRGHPEVLKARWGIYAAEKKWRECVEVAMELVRTRPEDLMGWIHRSYALHEMMRTREALVALLPAVEKFPEVWLIRYNLACYNCVLGDLAAAKVFLEEACELGDAKEIKLMAGEDPDLEKLGLKIGGD